ncbi:hypothetical protein [Chryseobacterium jejuense]|uniref:hypothetical protein n=1 Tax=Chryseobacterium jejuense TaxID=445960 RepID=UPI001AE40F4B|nr:hypothetical protein [Chryseobacterium jejuense]MBP2615072.1 hypothetical protein [Chryseobacterium jejuense]
MRTVIYISIIICCLQACKDNKRAPKATDKTVTTDTARINGVLLELIDNSGVSKLKITPDTYKFSGNIKIKSPCYFLRHNGKVVSYAYPQFNIQKIILILGNTKKDSLNKISGTEIQGILFKNDSIKIVGALKNYSPIDIETGVDEKDYWGFASGTYKN